jgi:ubiquinone/menaquinone biosynthesis C-methylase UbiE
MVETTESFDGFIGGRVYDLVARLSGYGPAFYRRVALAIPIEPGMTVLDLGCGTASVSLAVAERMQGQGRVIGIDLAERQLEQARAKIGSAAVPIELHHGSVRELPLGDESIDGICMSQVMHALPDDVRSECLAESFRVLRNGGFFGLVEWTRPSFGWAGAIWSLSLLGARDSHNWRGTYPELFKPHGFELATDVRLDSLNRCQVFVKRG